MNTLIYLFPVLVLAFVIGNRMYYCVASLTQVAFLPFGLLIDMWRWDVFSGKINESQWNAHWWELR
jgi:hypothetical protein